jgi:hypothetical protein
VLARPRERNRVLRAVVSLRSERLKTNPHRGLYFGWKVRRNPTGAGYFLCMPNSKIRPLVRELEWNLSKPSASAAQKSTMSDVVNVSDWEHSKVHRMGVHRESDNAQENIRPMKCGRDGAALGKKFGASSAAWQDSIKAQQAALEV